MIRDIPEFKRIKEDSTDSDALDQAGEGIIRIAKEDHYTRAIILCMIGAIERGNTRPLADACALFATRELKEKLETAISENIVN